MYTVRQTFRVGDLGGPPADVGYTRFWIRSGGRDSSAYCNRWAGAWQTICRYNRFQADGRRAHVHGIRCL